MRADAVSIDDAVERHRTIVDRPAGMDVAPFLFQFREVERIDPNSILRRLFAAKIGLVLWATAGEAARANANSGTAQTAAIASFKMLRIIDFS